MATVALKPEDLNADQKNSMRMHGFLKDDGTVVRQPDQITKAGLLIYDLSDPKTEHQDTLLVIYSHGATATFGKEMNLPEGVKV